MNQQDKVNFICNVVRTAMHAGWHRDDFMKWAEIAWTRYTPARAGSGVRGAIVNLEAVAEQALEAACKEPSALTAEETTLIAFAAGCELERTDQGYRIKNPVTIQKIDGKLRVCESRR